MTIITALEKIDTLSACELRHCVQRLDEEIVQYERSVQNYTPAKLKRFGVPYLKALNERRQRFLARLEQVV